MISVKYKSEVKERLMKVLVNHLRKAEDLAKIISAKC